GRGRPRRTDGTRSERTVAPRNGRRRQCLGIRVAAAVSGNRIYCRSLSRRSHRALGRLVFPRAGNPRGFDDERYRGDLLRRRTPRGGDTERLGRGNSNHEDGSSLITRRIHHRVSMAKKKNTKRASERIWTFSDYRAFREAAKKEHPDFDTYLAL